MDMLSFSLRQLPNPIRETGWLKSSSALGIVIEYDLDDLAFAAVDACDGAECEEQLARSKAGIRAEISFFFMGVVYMVITSSS